jgi:hypothetical protein
VNSVFQALIVLKENEPPFAINLLESVTLMAISILIALGYGKFEILPEHTDRCEIVGPLFTRAGSLVLSSG